MFAAPPIMNLVVLRSADIDRLETFYSEMGLLFGKHRHGDGPEHYVSTVNGFMLEIYPLGSGSPTAGLRIGFSVADVDLVVESLVAGGGTVVSHPQDSEWGRRAIVNGSRRPYPGADHAT